MNCSVVVKNLKSNSNDNFLILDDKFQVRFLCQPRQLVSAARAPKLSLVRPLASSEKPRTFDLFRTFAPLRGYLEVCDAKSLEGIKRGGNRKSKVRLKIA